MGENKIYCCGDSQAVPARPSGKGRLKVRVKARFRFLAVFTPTPRRLGSPVSIGTVADCVGVRSGAGLEYVELYCISPSTSVWRGCTYAQGQLYFFRLFCRKFVNFQRNSRKASQNWSKVTISRVCVWGGGADADGRTTGGGSRSGLSSRRLAAKNSRSCTWWFSSYRAVNTLRLSYKNQPVNAV
jgi:hypothetical protein